MFPMYPVRVLGVLTIGAFGLLSGISIAADISGAEAAPKPVTFAKDVAPILQERCQECHRKGSMAPMSLVTYEETRPWAKAIRQRVITRQMPPWHIDKTVGVQKFKNDMSLTRRADRHHRAMGGCGRAAGRSQGHARSQAVAAPRTNGKPRRNWAQPDLVIKSEPYTMAAHHQDVWWRPTSNIPITEPRWVRAVEMRPGTAAGRKITHHAVAYLAQDDPGSVDAGVGDPDLSARAMLMEWAIGKGYDLYRPDTGKLLLPGSQISWDVHIHAVGEEIRDNVELGIWLYPKGQEPKYRTYLTGVSGVARIPDLAASQTGRPEHRYPAELDRRSPTITRC